MSLSDFNPSLKDPIRKLVVDIEGNGLLKPTEDTPAVDRVHCLVIRDQDTKAVVMSCANHDARKEYPEVLNYPDISEGLVYLMNQDPATTLIVIHNGIGYDYPALRKVYPWFKLKNIRARLMDTLVIGGMLWAHLYEEDGKDVARGKLPVELRGSHSLKAWGIRLKCHKGDYAGGWSKWTPEMHRYCEQDTMTLAVYADHIQNRVADSAGSTLSLATMSIETELELAWYLFRQEQNGWPFNMEKAHKLYASLSARREALIQELKKAIKPWLKPIRKKGMVEVKVPARDRKGKSATGMPIQYVAGAPYSCLELVEFSPSSRPQIADRLIKLHGWQPTSFTKGGQPEVDESSLEPLAHIPEVKLIMEYLMVVKRIGQLAEGPMAWLKKATKHPFTNKFHIHGRVKQSGTVTHRGAHVDPNLGQVPACGAPYGEECRELFEVPDCPSCGASDCPECPLYDEHWVQIGADQSGLELRMLSHYMARWDDGKYGQSVVAGKNEDGTDVHSQNRNALGLSGKAGRTAAKTFIYAFLYGAGDLKLGTEIPPTPEQVAEYRANKLKWSRAKASLTRRKMPTDDRTISAMIHGGVLRERFLKNVPALKSLTEAVKTAATTFRDDKGQGYLLLLDKRRVYIRHAHAALNSLLQGAGAVVCKRWIVHLNRRLEAEFGKQGWEYLWAAMGWIHDEVQIAVRRKIAARVMVILVEEARNVGVHFKLRIPTDGEAKLGRNWKDTH